MKHKNAPAHRDALRGGFTLLELIGTVAIVAGIAALLLSRFAAPTTAAKKNACAINKGNIELQARLWYRSRGVWPAANLADIGSHPGYFPQAVPVCPVDGTAYTIDTATGRVVGHTH